MAEYQVILDIANIASGFATAAVAFFVFYQLRQTNRQLTMTEQEVKMTKQQMESSLRPWIGADTGLTELDTAKGRFGFYYRNYGSLPTIGMKIYSIAADEKIERAELLNWKDESWPYVGIIQPGQIKSYLMDIPNFRKAQLLICAELRNHTPARLPS